MLFANLQLAIWAFFLSVIPLIIVYLLKPKAKDISIPSVMFITQITEKQKKIARTIRKIIKDPLFLIQLLILILLILAIASPYNEERTEIRGGHTILILDGSASMQAGDRFDESIKLAGEHLTARNSIILAKNTPVLALHSGDLDAARDVLKDLPRTATTADLYQAILLSSAMLTDGKGGIVVISDFANWEGEDPNVAKKLAEADGIDVSFVSVSGGRNDIAITGGWLSDGMEARAGQGKYTCIIKNYMDSPVNVKIDVLYGGDRSTHNLALVDDLIVHLDHEIVQKMRSCLRYNDSEDVLVADDHGLAPDDLDARIIPGRRLRYNVDRSVRSGHDRDRICKFTPVVAVYITDQYDVVVSSGILQDLIPDRRLIP